MLVFSLNLVFEKESDKNRHWHDKGSNKIRESHSVWWNISNHGAIWIHVVINNWFKPWSGMQVPRLFLQRNQPFSHVRITATCVFSKRTTLRRFFEMFESPRHARQSFQDR